MVHIKSAHEIEKMAEAGRIVASVLLAVSRQVRPGISTADLDTTARDLIAQSGAVPSFLGYGQPPFPAAICASIDAEVVHGIPNARRLLRDGDIISIDVGAFLDGYTETRPGPSGRRQPESSVSSMYARKLLKGLAQLCPAIVWRPSAAEQPR
jgi:methionyl aminopeptidase